MTQKVCYAIKQNDQPTQNSRTGASPSDDLVSYPGYLLGMGSYPSTEMQLTYSSAPAYWAAFCILKNKVYTKENHDTCYIVF